MATDNQNDTQSNDNNSTNIDDANVVEEVKASEAENITEETLEEVIIDDTNAVEAKKDEKERFKIRVGDTVIVDYKIIEGKKTRVQPYEGIVIAKKNVGMSKTFTVRRMAVGNIGVERIFPLFSPNIENIKIKNSAKVRRAKLYYLRERVGKAATKV